MVIIKILTGVNAGKSIDVSSEKPAGVLESLSSTNSEWEIDYSKASPVEKGDWFPADLYYRCFRALWTRRLPVTFLGKIYNNFEEFKDRTAIWFKETKTEIKDTWYGTTYTNYYILAGSLSLIRDDDTGVQIEQTGYESEEIILQRQRAIYEECIKEKIEYKKKGLKEEYFLKFFRNDLHEKISQNLNVEVNELLDYAAQFRLNFKRTYLSEILSSVIKQETDNKLAFRLRELIRTTKN